MVDLSQEKGTGVTMPLNENSGCSKASARDAMASLYKTLKEATPNLPLMSSVDPLDEKLAGLRETRRAMAAKYGVRTGIKGKETSRDYNFKSYQGKASSEDLISLGNEPFLTKKSSDWQGNIGRSSRAPFRPSPPRTPLNFGPKDKESEPGDGILDGVVSKLKDFTSNFVGNSWGGSERTENESKDETMDSQFGEDSDRHSLLGSSRQSGNNS